MERSAQKRRSLYGHHNTPASVGFVLFAAAGDLRAACRSVRARASDEPDRHENALANGNGSGNANDFDDDVSRLE